MTEQATQSKTVEQISLSLSEDKLFLYISLAPDIEESEKLFGQLESKLKKFGLNSVDTVEEAVKRLRAILQEGYDSKPHVLLGGIPIVPSEDGRIEWSRDFFNSGFKISEDSEQIDYRQRAVDMTVSKDDLLAEVIPPKSGQDGVDVFGGRIPVSKGKEVQLKEGANVRIEGSRYFSDLAGRINYSKNVLAVDDLYTVPGSVNLKVGYINHPGAVFIQENVEPKSKVEAQGDIVIAGYVEDADVTSGGDLHVGGGVFGKDGNKIRVEGELHAKFLGNAIVESEGDIFIEKYIDNCHIFTRGKVHIPKGRIAGGEIVALGGITVGEAGSDACIATHLTAGKDFRLQSLLQSSQDEEEKLQAELHKIDEGLDKVKDKIALLGDKAKEAIAALQIQSNEIRDRLVVLKAEIEELSSASKEIALDEIIVLNRIFPASSLTVKGITKLVNQGAPGPVKVAIRDGDIAVVVHRA